MTISVLSDPAEDQIKQNLIDLMKKEHANIGENGNIIVVYLGENGELQNIEELNGNKFYLIRGENVELPQKDTIITDYTWDNVFQMTMDVMIEDLIIEKKKYADKMGWALNPKDRALRGLLRMLIKNEKEYGIPFCPCKGDLINVKKKINDKEVYVSECPCIDCEQEVDEFGYCHCHLFYKQ